MSTDGFGWDATELDDFSQDDAPLDDIPWDATDLDDSQSAMKLADFQPRQPNPASIDPNDLPWGSLPPGKSGDPIEHYRVGERPPQTVEPRQRTAAEVINLVWWDYVLDPPRNASPPTPAQLADYLLRDDCPRYVVEEFITIALIVWGNASEPAPFPLGFFGNIIPNHWETAIVWFDAAWSALPEDDRPPHPLLALVEAYIAHAAPMVEPERRQRGILPRFTAIRHQRAIVKYLPGLDHPSLPGLVMPANAPALAYLPGLAPNAPKSPALMLALFDQGGGTAIAGNGHVKPEASIFIELLLSIPAAARNGHLQQMAFRHPRDRRGVAAMDRARVSAQRIPPMGRTWRAPWRRFTTSPCLTAWQGSTGR